MARRGYTFELPGRRGSKIGLYSEVRELKRNTRTLRGSSSPAAGKHQVELEDFDFSYGLYADNMKLATFAEGRIGYREWALRSGHLEYINSLEDRYDRDVDELMA